MTVLNLENEWRTLQCPPGRGEEIFWHEEGAKKGVSALGLKCRSNGTKVWIWDYRAKDGAKRRRTYGAPDKLTFDEALTAVLKDQVALREGIDIAPKRSAEAGEASISFSDLLDKFFASLAYRRRRDGDTIRYADKVKARLEHARKAWGARDAASIGRKDISDLLDLFNDRPALQELIQVHLGTFFAFAVDRGELEANPIKGMKMRGGVKERERFLDEEELRLVLPELKALAYPAGHALQLQLLTARRIGEVVGAEWSEFDLDRGTWTLPAARSKNHKAHTLPLPKMALDLLRDMVERKIGDGRYVFHREKSDHPILEIDRDDLERVRKAATAATVKRDDPQQREPWTAHDLRRTAATMLEFLEAPDGVIKAVLNHSRGRDVTALYTRMMADKRLRLDMLQKWLDKLATYYESLLRPVLALPAPDASTSTSTTTIGRTAGDAESIG